MAQYLGLDFETFSGVDITKVGLDNYINHPDFTPLLGAIAWRDSPTSEISTHLYDFVQRRSPLNDFPGDLNLLVDDGRTLVAHNSMFEKLVLNRQWSTQIPDTQIIDTAVLTRCMGADSKLENAAPQLLDPTMRKHTEGKRLIRKFSTGTRPSKDQVKDDPDWKLYGEYCVQDAKLSLLLAEKFAPILQEKELRYQQLTEQMNLVGWKVDLDIVDTMQRLYEENKAALLDNFQLRCDPGRTLNLNSTVQLKKWCAERGIKATSFDEAHVSSLLTRLNKALQAGRFSGSKRADVLEVVEMLKVKQALGGSSLSKLPKIKELTGPDGRLRHQYMHVGAGQSYRTSSVGVQMQNLKRLDGNHLGDMDSMEENPGDWSNDKLAENLRQVFTATDPDGELVVGDFSSVESRGLAYVAGENWKLDAYHKGQDLYRVLGAKIGGLTYDEVPKSHPLRQTGKVGELACGYGAGAGAVASFAQGMGIEMTEAEAGNLVSDWRSINPMVVKMWNDLNDTLLAAVKGLPTNVELANHIAVRIAPISTPESLRQIHPGARSLKVVMYVHDTLFLSRVFHGCYLRGRDIIFYKASSKVNGPLWADTYVNPKTKLLTYYKVYGGKLTGILIQSMCRQVFFNSLSLLSQALDGTCTPIVGQFHDEIVVDWNPQRSHLNLQQLIKIMHECMSDPGPLKRFPLEADIKHAHRYIK